MSLRGNLLKIDILGLQTFLTLFHADSLLVVWRASYDPGALAWWEVAGAVTVLIGSTRLAITIGASLFRVGLLSTGTRPTLREALRQARLAD